MKKQVTMAVANKMLRTLEEERNYWQHIERNDSVYTVAQGEEPVKPRYDYFEIAEEIDNVNAKIMNLKHAIQVHHTMSEIRVEGEVMTADMLQCLIEQTNNRKSFLGNLRKLNPVTRISSRDKKLPPEIRYINFDQKVIFEEYDVIAEKLMNLQTAYELFQQTSLFEIEVEG